MTTATFTDIRTVAIPVADQDRALRFYVDVLGFETRLDAEIGPGLRWIEVAAPGAGCSVALTAAPDATSGTDTGIRLTTPDAAATHAALSQRRADVDELLAWPDVPPMFSFRDPDGNTLYVVEAA